jgi:hypothetical protein
VVTCPGRRKAGAIISPIGPHGDKFGDEEMVYFMDNVSDALAKITA